MTATASCLAVGSCSVMGRPGSGFQSAVIVIAIAIDVPSVVLRTTSGGIVVGQYALCSSILMLSGCGGYELLRAGTIWQILSSRIGNFQIRSGLVQHLSG